MRPRPGSGATQPFRWLIRLTLLIVCVYPLVSFFLLPDSPKPSTFHDFDKREATLGAEQFLRHAKMRAHHSHQADEYYADIPPAGAASFGGGQDAGVHQHAHSMGTSVNTVHTAPPVDDSDPFGTGHAETLHGVDTQHTDPALGVDERNDAADEDGGGDNTGADAQHVAHGSAASSSPPPFLSSYHFHTCPFHSLSGASHAHLHRDAKDTPYLVPHKYTGGEVREEVLGGASHDAAHATGPARLHTEIPGTRRYHPTLPSRAHLAAAPVRSFDHVFGLPSFFHQSAADVNEATWHARSAEWVVEREEKELAMEPFSAHVHRDAAAAAAKANPFGAPYPHVEAVVIGAGGSGLAAAAALAGWREYGLASVLPEYVPNVVGSAAGAGGSDAAHTAGAQTAHSSATSHAASRGRAARAADVGASVSSASSMSSTLSSKSTTQSGLLRGSASAAAGLEAGGLYASAAASRASYSVSRNRLNRNPSVVPSLASRLPFSPAPRPPVHRSLHPASLGRDALVPTRRVLSSTAPALLALLNYAREVDGRGRFGNVQAAFGAANQVRSGLAGAAQTGMAVAGGVNGTSASAARVSTDADSGSADTYGVFDVAPFEWSAGEFPLSMEDIVPAFVLRECSLAVGAVAHMADAVLDRLKNHAAQAHAHARGRNASTASFDSFVPDGVHLRPGDVSRMSQVDRVCAIYWLCSDLFPTAFPSLAAPMASTKQVEAVQHAFSLHAALAREPFGLPNVTALRPYFCTKTGVSCSGEDASNQTASSSGASTSAAAPAAEEIISLNATATVAHLPDHLPRPSAHVVAGAFNALRQAVLTFPPEYSGFPNGRYESLRVPATRAVKRLSSGALDTSSANAANSGVEELATYKGMDPYQFMKPFYESLPGVYRRLAKLEHEGELAVSGLAAGGVGSGAATATASAVNPHSYDGWERYAPWPSVAVHGAGRSTGSGVVGGGVGAHHGILGTAHARGATTQEAVEGARVAGTAAGDASTHDLEMAYMQRGAQLAGTTFRPGNRAASSAAGGRKLMEVTGAGGAVSGHHTLPSSSLTGSELDHGARAHRHRGLGGAAFGLSMAGVPGVRVHKGIARGAVMGLGDDAAAAGGATASANVVGGAHGNLLDRHGHSVHALHGSAAHASTQKPSEGGAAAGGAVGLGHSTFGGSSSAEHHENEEGMKLYRGMESSQWGPQSVYGRTVGRFPVGDRPMYLNNQVRARGGERADFLIFDQLAAAGQWSTAPSHVLTLSHGLGMTLDPYPMALFMAEHGRSDWQTSAAIEGWQVNEYFRSVPYRLGFESSVREWSRVVDVVAVDDDGCTIRHKPTLNSQQSGGYVYLPNLPPIDESPFCRAKKRASAAAAEAVLSADGPGGVPAAGSFAPSDRSPSAAAARWGAPYANMLSLASAQSVEVTDPAVAARLKVLNRAADRVAAAGEDGVAGFIVTVQDTVRGNYSRYTADFVIYSGGQRSSLRRLGVPGEDLPWVKDRYTDFRDAPGPLVYIVGGGMSGDWAVQDLWFAGRNVTYAMRRSRTMHITSVSGHRQSLNVGYKFLHDIMYGPLMRRARTIFTEALAKDPNATVPVPMPDPPTLSANLKSATSTAVAASLRRQYAVQNDPHGPLRKRLQLLYPDLAPFFAATYDTFVLQEAVTAATSHGVVAGLYNASVRRVDPATCKEMGEPEPDAAVVEAYIAAHHGRSGGAGRRGEDEEDDADDGGHRSIHGSNIGQAVGLRGRSAETAARSPDAPTVGGVAGVGGAAAHGQLDHRAKDEEISASYQAFLKQHYATTDSAKYYRAPRVAITTPSATSRKAAKHIDPNRPWVKLYKGKVYCGVKVETYEWASPAYNRASDAKPTAAEQAGVKVHTAFAHVMIKDIGGTANWAPFRVPGITSNVKPNGVKSAGRDQYATGPDGIAAGTLRLGLGGYPSAGQSNILSASQHHSQSVGSAIARQLNILRGVRRIVEEGRSPINLPAFYSAALAYGAHPRAGDQGGWAAGTTPVSHAAVADPPSASAPPSATATNRSVSVFDAGTHTAAAPAVGALVRVAVGSPTGPAESSFGGSVHSAGTSMFTVNKAIDTIFASVVPLKWGDVIGSADNVTTLSLVDADAASLRGSDEEPSEEDTKAGVQRRHRRRHRHAAKVNGTVVSGVRGKTFAATEQSVIGDDYAHAAHHTHEETRSSVGLQLDASHFEGYTSALNPRLVAAAEAVRSAGEIGAKYVWDTEASFAGDDVKQLPVAAASIRDTLADAFGVVWPTNAAAHAHPHAVAVAPGLPPSELTIEAIAAAAARDGAGGAHVAPPLPATYSNALAAGVRALKELHPAMLAAEHAAQLVRKEYDVAVADMVAVAMRNARVAAAVDTMWLAGIEAHLVGKDAAVAMNAESGNAPTAGSNGTAHDIHHRIPDGLMELVAHVFHTPKEEGRGHLSAQRHAHVRNLFRRYLSPFYRRSLPSTHPLHLSPQLRESTLRGKKVSKLIQGLSLDALNAPVPPADLVTALSQDAVGGALAVLPALYASAQHVLEALDDVMALFYHVQAAVATAATLANPTAKHVHSFVVSQRVAAPQPAFNVSVVMDAFLEAQAALEVLQRLEPIKRVYVTNGTRSGDDAEDSGGSRRHGSRLGWRTGPTIELTQRMVRTFGLVANTFTHGLSEGWFQSVQRTEVDEHMRDVEREKEVEEEEAAAARHHAVGSRRGSHNDEEDVEEVAHSHRRAMRSRPDARDSQADEDLHERAARQRRPRRVEVGDGEEGDDGQLHHFRSRIHHMDGSSAAADSEDGEAEAHRRATREDGDERRRVRRPVRSHDEDGGDVELPRRSRPRRSEHSEAADDGGGHVVHRRRRFSDASMEHEDVHEERGVAREGERIRHRRSEHFREEGGSEGEVESHASRPRRHSSRRGDFDDARHRDHEEARHRDLDQEEERPVRRRRRRVHDDVDAHDAGRSRRASAAEAGGDGVDVPASAAAFVELAFRNYVSVAPTFPDPETTAGAAAAVGSRLTFTLHTPVEKLVDPVMVMDETMEAVVRLRNAADRDSALGKLEALAKAPSLDVRIPAANFSSVRGGGCESAPLLWV